MVTRLNKHAYEKLINEDIKWLLLQPKTLERDHIHDLLLWAIRNYGLRQSNERLQRELEQAQAKIAAVDDIVFKIECWCSDYPVEVFPEPTKNALKVADEALRHRGLTMAGFFASNTRHVLSGISGYAEGIRKALQLGGE